MLKPLAIFAALAVPTGACAQASSASNAERSEAMMAPRGATIGPQGYATILDSPPAPFVVAVPGVRPALTPEQLAAHAQFRRVGEFQNRVREDVQNLAARLRRSEKGNYIDLYYENEGDPHVVFRFLHDGARTLAKYTRNPKFVAASGRYTNAQLRAALDFMMDTFREDRVIAGGGYGNKQNRAEIEINVTEPEFRALVARKGVKIPDAVDLKFAATRPASEINRPLPPEVARFVRIFPRDDRPIGMLNAILSRAKVVLEDGCFRIGSGEDAGAHVLFPLGARLHVDRQGYLAYGDGSEPDYGRVGEEIVFPGSIAEVTAPELVRPIHAACGPGKVIKVNGMRSASAERAETAATQNSNSFRELKQTYGLSEPLARKVFEACKKNMGSGTCILSPPPPARREECPSGTTFSSGLCRTPEGYIRPLPKWIAELARS